MPDTLIPSNDTGHTGIQKQNKYRLLIQIQFDILKAFFTPDYWMNFTWGKRRLKRGIVSIEGR